MTTRDQLDMGLMAEAELSRLLRQYRIMEGDRKALLDETNNKLCKQRKIIATLTKERDNLLQDVKIANCENQKRKESKVTSRIEVLLQKNDDVTSAVREERTRLDELDRQVKKTEREVTRLRLKEVTEGEFQERARSGRKSVKMLENKLETVIRRFCVVLTENKQLREEIDHLLKERARFNDVWEKLLDDLSSGKKLMMDLIEQATLAYDQREECCSKLQALKIRAHNDVISHTQDMREMQRQLDHDSKLREFLLVKGQKRVMKDLEEKETKKREEEKEESEKQLQSYQTTLDKIKEFCNEEDVGKMAAKYLKQEEENFALFNYVNELNQELENLRESIEDFKEKVEEQEGQIELRALQQKHDLESLNDILKNAAVDAEKGEEELKKTEEELWEVLGKIEEIFGFLQCDSTLILDLLGENSKINEDNAMIYLGLIEKKVSGLITAAFFKEKSLMKSRRR